MSKVGDSSSVRDGKAARILARSLFRDMSQNGYNCSQILALATELIDLVTKDMRGDGEVDLRPAETPKPGLRSVG